MKNKELFNEVTPLSDADCFYIVDRVKTKFNYPIHVHDEFELNFVENAKGAMRIVGDSVEEIEDMDLVLITSENLEHGWFDHHCESKNIHEITIQFHSDLFFNIDKNQFNSIKQLFEEAKKGLTFSYETIVIIKPLLVGLSLEKDGVFSVINLLTILHLLSSSENRKILASSSFAKIDLLQNSRRLKKVFDYMNANFKNPIRLDQAAALVNMSKPSFCRFFKARTGKNFVESLSDIRLGIATRFLVDSTHSIAEVCYESGFNNLPNFNRIFKRKKSLTPKEFRAIYCKKKNII
ncbi:AraC family transcriptional regulator [Bacteroidales bacterium]|nr:AraC family transcriptional regulator [Bacteroidales bacterium]